MKDKNDFPRYTVYHDGNIKVNFSTIKEAKDYAIKHFTVKIIKHEVIYERTKSGIKVSRI